MKNYYQFGIMRVCHRRDWRDGWLQLPDGKLLLLSRLDRFTIKCPYGQSGDGRIKFPDGKGSMLRCRIDGGEPSPVTLSPLVYLWSFSELYDKESETAVLIIVGYGFASL